MFIQMARTGFCPSRLLPTAFRVGVEGEKEERRRRSVECGTKYLDKQVQQSIRSTHEDVPQQW